MKAKTAIEKLKTMYPKTCKMVDGRMQGGFDDTTCGEGEAINAAIKALEMQIPAKVTEIHVDDFICPSCGNESCTTDYSQVPSHCPECGQALYLEN